MKERIRVIWSYLFEIFIWFLFLWMGTLTIAYSYILPKEGTICIVGAIAFTFVPRIYKKFKKTEEE